MTLERNLKKHPSTLCMFILQANLPSDGMLLSGWGEDGVTVKPFLKKLPDGIEPGDRITAINGQDIMAARPADPAARLLFLAIVPTLFTGPLPLQTVVTVPALSALNFLISTGSSADRFLKAIAIAQWGNALLLAGIYLLLAGGLSLTARYIFPHTGDIFSGLLAAVGTALAFAPLRRWVQHVINRTFYRSSATYSEVLPGLISSLSRYGHL